MRFCIVGSGRCGSTFLRKMFAMHPAVFLRKELPIFPKLYAHAGHLSVPARDLIDMTAACMRIDGTPALDLPRNDIAARFDPDEHLTVRDFMDRLYLGFAAARGRKRQWADKCPDYGFVMRAIQDVWPTCKFIHLVRDGRDVALSMQRHPGFRWKVSAREISFSSVSYNGYFRSVAAGDPPPEAYLAFWAHAVRRIESEAEALRPDSYRVFRYEDLIRSPQDTLTEMTRFLSLRCPDAWMARCLQWPDATRLQRHQHSDTGFAASAEVTQLLTALGYDAHP